MSLLTGSIIPQAQVARSLTSVQSVSDVSVQLTAASAINTAIDAGTFTASFSVSGLGQVKIQGIMNLLENLGYDVSLSSTTVTVTW